MDISNLLSEEAAKRYGQLELLAEGGMGAVYRAWDSQVVRSVILKFPRGEKLEERSTIKRFESEAYALAQLDHPNVVRLFDLERNDGHPFIVTEDVSGVSLREEIDNNAFTAHQAIDILANLARGIEAAHEKGILHRDLKPENVLVTPEGEAKLIDFGFAMSVTGEHFTRMTETGKVVGTFFYMAPEILMGTSDATEKSDIYSFGLLAYELLTGQHPYAGVPLECICDLSQEIDVLPPSFHCENIDSNIDKLVLEMIDRHLSQRPSSSKSVRRRFERWLQRSDLMANEATKSVIPVKATPKRERKELPVIPVTANKDSSSGKSRKLLLAAVIVFMLCMLGNLLYKQWQSQKAEIAIRKARLEQAQREERAGELRDWLLAKPPSAKGKEFYELSNLLPNTSICKRLGLDVKADPTEMTLTFLTRCAKKSLPQKEWLNWLKLLVTTSIRDLKNFEQSEVLKEFLLLSKDPALLPQISDFVSYSFAQWPGDRAGSLLLLFLNEIVPPRDFKGATKAKAQVRQLRPLLQSLMEKASTKVSLSLFEKLYSLYIEYVAYTSVDDQIPSIVKAAALLEGKGREHWRSRMRVAEAMATLFDPPEEHLRKALKILDGVANEVSDEQRDLVDVRRAIAKTMIAGRIHRNGGKNAEAMAKEARRLSEKVSLRSKGKKHHNEVLLFRIMTMSGTLFTSLASEDDASQMIRLLELVDTKSIPKADRYLYLHAKAEVLQNNKQYNKAGDTLKEGISCAPYSHKSGMLAILTYYGLVKGLDFFDPDTIGN